MSSKTAQYCETMFCCKYILYCKWLTVLLTLLLLYLDSVGCTTEIIYSYYGDFYLRSHSFSFSDIKIGRLYNNGFFIIIKVLWNW